MYRTIPCSLQYVFQPSKLWLNTSAVRPASHAATYRANNPNLNYKEHVSVQHPCSFHFRQKATLASQKAIDGQTTPALPSQNASSAKPFSGLPPWVQSAIDRDVYTAQDLSSLMDLTKQANFNNKNAANLVAFLGTWIEQKRVDPYVLKQNADFQRICTLLESGNAKVNAYSLLQAIRALHLIGFTSDSFLINALENDLLWNLRKLHLRQLIHVADFQQTFQQTDTQKRVLKEVVQAIQRRWVEITDIRDLVLIYNLSHIFEDSFLVKLEDRLVESMESFKSEDKVKLLSTLAVCKRRPTPLLRSLAFHLNKDSTKLAPKHLADLLFALNRLSFPDQVLLERVGNDLMNDIAQLTKPVLISAFLTNMGQLRYRNTNVLEALAEWVEENWEKCRSQEFVAFLLCFAAVDYIPSNSATLFPKLKEVLTKENVRNDLVWLDVVWSWAVFDQATAQELRSVLDSGLRPENPIVQSKFDNLRTLATKNPRYKLSYPVNQTGLDSKLTEITTPSLTRAVLDALSNFVPSPRYLKEHVNTTMGVLLDAEFIMTPSCTPLALADYESKPLPAGACRIALKVLDYKNVCLGSINPTGYNSLARRLLELNNYRVVFVPYTEFPSREKLLKKVQYLEQSVKASITGDQI